MAYYQKYYKDLGRENGPSYRLIISEYYTGSAPSGYPIEIGGLVSCNLNLQGEQSDIIQGVVKTSLEMTLVDVYDDPLVTRDGHYVKQGQWEEFFTPDSMKFKVMLVRLTGSMSVPIWTGYITPDSYEEQLIYHGTISIIARDNIGHLGDLYFDGTEDESGMIKVRSIVQQALAKVGAMSLNIDSTDISSGFHILASDAAWEIPAVWIADTYVSMTSLRGKTWLQALEDVLDSTGLVLRFDGQNGFYLAEIGVIPEFLEGSRSGSHTTRYFKMLENSGRRRFIPAVRSITETFDADWAGLLELNTEAGDYQETWVSMGGLQRQVDTPAGNNPLIRTGAIAMMNPLRGQTPGVPRRGGVASYSGRDLFFTVIRDDSPLENYGSIKAMFQINEGGVELKMRFRFFIGAFSRDGDNIEGGNTGVIFTQDSSGARKPSGAYHQAMTVRYSVAYEDSYGNRSTMREDGSFVGLTDTPLTQSIENGNSSSSGRYGEFYGDVDKTIKLPNYSGTLMIWFYPFEIENNNAPVSDLSTGKYYGRITNLEIVPADEDWEGYKVTTEYSASNNVKLERSPKYGEVPAESISQLVIKNGIYVKDYYGAFFPAGLFYWRGYYSQRLVLSGLIHQQILQYYSRTERQLTADIIDNLDGIIDFSNVYNYVLGYESEKYLITSGSFDIVNNVLRNVVMRTWRSWQYLWGS